MADNEALADNVGLLRSELEEYFKECKCKNLKKKQETILGIVDQISTLVV